MKQTIPAHIYRHSDSCLTFCGLNRAPKRTHLEGCKGYPCTCTTFVDCEECKASKERKRQSQAEAAKRMLQTRREREAAISRRTLKSTTKDDREIMTMTQFTKGQKVRTIWGTVVTVLEQIGSTVYVYEGPLDWYHVTKVFAIES